MSPKAKIEAMKHIFLIALLITGTVVNAQRNTLPERVKTTFEEKYPDAEKVKIRTIKDHYNIRFILNEKPSLTVYEKEGAWVKTETRLTKGELPAMVINAIDKKYSKGTYNKAVYCEQSEGGDFYQVEVDTPGAIFYLEIDHSGKMLKTEKIEKPKEISPPTREDDGDGYDGEG
ncbi:PepSY-like domain-containing protein [Bacteroidota bacterium]